jgi:hypothetical protein
MCLYPNISLDPHAIICGVCNSSCACSRGPLCTVITCVLGKNFLPIAVFLKHPQSMSSLKCEITKVVFCNDSDRSHGHSDYQKCVGYLARLFALTN